MQNTDQISLWSGRFESAKNAQTSLRMNFSRWYKSFFAASPTVAAPWRSKVIDPKISSKGRSILAKVALFDPQPNFIPNDDHDFMKAKNNEVLISNDLRNSLFDKPMFLKKYDCLSDAVICGTGIAIVPWKTTTQTYYQRVLDGKGKVDMKNEKKKEVKLGYNEFQPISIFRYFPEPEASSDQAANWMIIQDFKTPEEVMEMADKGTKLADMEGLAGDTSTSETKMLELSRNNALQVVTDGNENKVEVWHCWDKLKKSYCIIAGGSVVICDDKNYYWHGKYPIVTFKITPRAHSIWGQGIFESTERLGAANDSLINHFFDQLDLALNGMVMRDHQTQIIDWNIAPGGELVYSGIKPEQMKMEMPDGNTFQLARNVLTEAIEENTVSQYEVGIPRSGSDKTGGTKGGIQAIQEAASDIVRFFERCYAETHKQLYTIWLSNNQQFMDRERAVRILGNGGYYPRKIRPEDIITAGTLDVEVDIDEMRPRNKEFDRAMTSEYVSKVMEIYAVSQKAAQEDQTQTTKPIQLNFHELLRVLSDSMGRKDFDRIVEPMSQVNDSPTQENELMLQGKEITPNPQDDHKIHMQVHQELLDDKGVDQEIQINAATHIQMHQQMLELAEEQKNQQELARLKQMEADTARAAGGIYPGIGSDLNQQNAPMAQGVTDSINAHLAGGGAGAPGAAMPGTPPDMGAGMPPQGGMMPPAGGAMPPMGGGAPMPGMEQPQPQLNPQNAQVSPEATASPVF